jgi:[acyl-carrier-protein] S-malonyltransferase
VIAGDAAAVERACAEARARGAKKTVLLPVSAPFHCALMAPAGDKLAAELAAVRFEEPTVPVVTNVEAEPNADPARMPELLRRQLTAPVRFSESVARLARLGVSRVLEIGPGRVLSGLVARIERGLARANLSRLADLEGAGAFARGPGG